MTSDFVPSLAAFAAAPSDPPPLALDVARLSALDWVAVGRAGIGEDVSRHLRACIAADGGAPVAHGFGLAGAVPARAAAWLNGTTGHALDYDDTHFAHIGHPSVAVFPAALAMGEAAGARLPAVIEAALLGMEVSIRVGLWLGRAHYAAGFHQTATAGSFGAAIAAGRLAGFDEASMAQVLGLVATRAAGLKAQFGTMGKPLNAGFAAQNGVEAAQLVAAGITGNPAALDGPHGFGATHAGQDDTGAALAGLGTEWLFETVSHKFHACCHGLHAALEALRELDVAAPEIARVSVRTHPDWMPVCNQTAPATGLGAKFSYRTALAMLAAGHDTARLDSFTDAVCADPAVTALRDRIEVAEDPALSETEAEVEVLLRNGARRGARHDLAELRPIAARTDRVEAKAAALIGATATAELRGLIGGQGEAADLGRFLSAPVGS